MHPDIEMTKEEYHEKTCDSDLDSDKQDCPLRERDKHGDIR